MGGNATGIIKSTGETTRAQKVEFTKVSRSEFVKKTLELLTKINDLYYKKFKEKIWDDEKILKDGTAFNGSTSFIMNTSIPDDEILKFKSSAGDIDVTVPDYCRENLWKLLDSLEDKTVISGVKYKGCCQPSYSPGLQQFNSVFEIEFKSGTVYTQIDFELMPFVNNKPNEWTKFSHSSSLSDYEKGVKGGVFHKLLIRSIVGAASIRNDVVIASPSSTPEKLKISTSKKYINPRFTAFSVLKGIRDVFKPMLDADGNIVKYQGKEVYQEIPTKDSTFVDQIDGIFKITFHQYKASKADLKLFDSFVGVIELMKKYFDKKTIKMSHDRFINILWGEDGGRAQELENGNPELDFSLKNSAYQYFIKELGLKDESSKYVDKYYKEYGQRRARLFGVTEGHVTFAEFIGL